MLSNRILVTGGLGFIGGAVIRNLLINTSIKIFNLDKVSYASDFYSIKHTISKYKIDDKRYHFIKQDLKDRNGVRDAIEFSDPDIVIHLAAESHVDKSIQNPRSFIESNIIGTFNLLECSHQHYINLSEERKKCFRFHHVSTDEVFGSLGDNGFFKEDSPYDPRSPYSASKASSDHLVNAWNHTYGLPVVVTNCSNNFGPWQYPEKLIPKTIINAFYQKPIDVYGEGLNVRDWLFVDDHAEAILLTCFNSLPGEKFCIGGNCERKNITLVKQICAFMDQLIPRNNSYENLIRFVKDRPGHDNRYAIDSSKIFKRFKWEPTKRFEERLLQTVEWYISNLNWVKGKI